MRSKTEHGVVEVAEAVSTFKPAEVFHPGEFIREEMRARGWTIDYLAALLGWQPTALRLIRNGHRSVVPDGAALDLAKVFGTSAEFWLNLQRAYDDSKAHSAGH